MMDDLKNIAAMIDQGTPTPKMDAPKPAGDELDMDPVELQGGDTELADGGIDADELDDGDIDADEGIGSGIKTIAQLAEAIEVDPEFLYNIEIGMPEGEEPIPLGKMKDQYQQVTKQNRQLQQVLEQQQQQLAEAQNGIGQSQQISQELQAARDQVRSIEAQYNSIDWEKAKMEDPGATALARQEFQEAFAAANGQLQHAEAYQQQMTQQMSHRQLVEAAQKTLELIPEWKDESVRSADEVIIQQALLEAGYSRQAIASARDPIAIALMRELVHLRAERAGSVKAVEKVRGAPKVLAGGSMRRNGGIQAQTKSLVERAKSTGRGDDQLNAAKAILAAASKR